MNKKKYTKRHIALLGVCIVLSCMLYVVASIGPSAPSFSTAQHDLMTKEPAPVFMDENIFFPKINAFDAVIERPLFYANRRPFVQEKKEKKTAVKKKVKQDPLNLILNAIIITPKKKVAIITPGRGKNAQKIQPGEKIQGWELIGLDKRWVKLSKGVRTERLELKNKVNNQTQARKKAIPPPAPLSSARAAKLNNLPRHPNAPAPSLAPAVETRP